MESRSRSEADRGDTALESHKRQLLRSMLDTMRISGILTGPQTIVPFLRSILDRS